LFKEKLQMKNRYLSLVLATMLLMLFVVVGAHAQGLPIYNNIPSPLPGNLASVGFEATGTSEFGDRIGFSTGSGRVLKTVTVTMSSWGCGTSGHWFSGDCVTASGSAFSHPVTLNVYNVGPGNTVGTLIGSTTQTFAIPFRPSADLINCTGDNAGKWFSASENHCYNGFATNITFNVTGITLPNQVIFGIAYNTSHYGYAPIGESPACYTSSTGCGYDSLNVGVSDPASSLSAGTNPSPNDAYQYTLYDSCSNGPIIPFGLDAGCWTGLKPSVRFNAANAPTNKDQCKGDGWKTFTRGDGSLFKNQGDCIQYANTGK
jgi:hypothetical protein